MGGDGTKYILIGAYSRLIPEAGAAEAEEESEAQQEDAASAVALSKMSVLQVWRHRQGCSVLPHDSEIRTKVVHSGLPTIL